MMNYRILLSWLTVACALVLLLSGCGGGGGGGGMLTGDGSADFNFSWPGLAMTRSRISLDGVNSLTISIHGIQRSLVLPQTQLHISGLPAGSFAYTVTAVNQTSGQTVATAQDIITIVNGKATAVTISADTIVPTSVAIGVEAGSTQVAMGSTLQLTAVGKTNAGAVLLLSPGGFSWSTDAPTIARVNANGLVTGYGTGTAHITATYANQGVPITQSLTVTVTGGTLPTLHDRIAVVSNRDGRYQLYLMGADGSGVTRLTTSTTTDSAPAINPITHQIAFASYRNGNWDLFLVNADGSNLQQLTATPEAEYAPAWSPDGQWLACDVWNTGSITFADGSPVLQNLKGIDTINVTSHEHKWLVNNGSDANWSPDGTQLVFSDLSSGRCLAVVKRDGSGWQQLIQIPSGMADARPIYSPDGSQVVFERHLDQVSNIYIVALDTRQVNQLTTTGKDYLPCWSPDGQHIAFASTRDGNTEVYTMSANGANPLRLTNNTFLDVPYSWEQW